jgi:hypothetical protein
MIGLLQIIAQFFKTMIGPFTAADLVSAHQDEFRFSVGERNGAMPARQVSRLPRTPAKRLARTFASKASRSCLWKTALPAGAGSCCRPAPGKPGLSKP